MENVLSGIDDIFDNLETTIENQDPSLSVSVGSIMNAEFEKYITDLNPEQDGKEALVRSMYRSKLDEDRSDYACTSFNEVGAVGYLEYADFGGDQYTNLKNGYVKLIEYLTRNLSSSNKIKLNEKVELIDYSASSNKIKVKTNKNITYKANYVISTISLGYLKENYRKLFNPQLPSDKINAIEALGFGTMDKIFLVFDEAIMQDDDQGFNFFWENDLPSLDTTYNLGVT